MPLGWSGITFSTNIVIFLICIDFFVYLYRLCFDNVTNLKNNNNLIRITDVEACLNYGVLCFKYYEDKQN